MNADMFAGSARFRTALLDPPWWEAGGGGRGAQNHYPLLKTHEMPAVILASGLWHFFEHAHCYLWTTNTFLVNGDALWLMQALGFRPKSLVTWSKPRAGLGQYFRGRTEHLIFGTRGKGQDASVYSGRKDLPNLITSPTGAHSQKPGAFKDLVMSRSHGPYLELFSREPPYTTAWTTWGNQAPLPTQGGSTP